MAKLPDIQYQSYSPANPGSPDQAVANSNQKVALVNQALAGAETVVNAHREYQLAKTYSSYADEMSAFRQEASKELAVTPAKIIAWGLDDKIDTTGRETIYKSEWYPLLLERQMEKTKAKYAGQIQSLADRTKFDQRVGDANNQMLESEIAQAAHDSQMEHEAIVKSDIDKAITNGQWDTAMVAAEHSGLMPSEVQNIKLKVIEAKDNNTIHDDIQRAAEIAQRTGDTSQLEALSEHYRSQDASEQYGVGVDKLDQWADQAANMADKIKEGSATGAEKANKFYAAADMANIYSAMNNPAIPPDQLAKMVADTQSRAAARGDTSTVKSTQSAWNNYKKNGGKGPAPIKNDPEAVIGVSNVVNDPNKSADEKLSVIEANRTGLDDKTYISFHQAVQKGSAGDVVTDSQNMSRIKTQLEAQLGPVAMKAHPEYLANMSSAYVQGMAAMAAEGKPVSSAERVKYADELLTEFANRPSITLDRKLWFDKTHADIFAALDDDPEAKAYVYKQVQTRGLPPSINNLTQLYNEYQQGTP